MLRKELLKVLIAALAVGAQSSASLAAPLGPVCPADAAHLRQLLNSLTKTSETNNSGLVVRSYSGAGMQMLGAMPQSANANWTGGDPVAAAFNLPGAPADYIRLFHNSLKDGEIKCDGTNGCAWFPSKSEAELAPGDLMHISLADDLGIGTATVRCEYN